MQEQPLTQIGSETMNKKFAAPVEIMPEENVHVLRHNKIILLLVTGVLFLLAAAILWQKVAAWNRTGWVGMEFQPGRNWVNKGEKHYFAVGKSLVTKGNPGYIPTVFEGGPADRAGIEPGSVVLEIAGIPLDSADTINALIASTRIGDTLAYRIRKDTTALEFTLSGNTTAVTTNFFEPGFEYHYRIGFSRHRILGLLEETGEPTGICALHDVSRCSGGFFSIFGIIARPSECDWPQHLNTFNVSANCADTGKCAQSLRFAPAFAAALCLCLSGGAR